MTPQQAARMVQNFRLEADVRNVVQCEAGDGDADFMVAMRCCGADRMFLCADHFDGLTRELERRREASGPGMFCTVCGAHFEAPGSFTVYTRVVGPL